MPKPISRRKLVSKLKKLGFNGPFSGGKHQFMEKGAFKLFIPNPHKGDISKVLVKQIMNDLKLSESEFLEL